MSNVQLSSLLFYMAFNSSVVTAEDDTPFNTPIRYSPAVDHKFLEQTKLKLSLARLPEEQKDVGPDDWSQGAKVDEVARLALFWQKKYDWTSRQVRISYTAYRRTTLMAWCRMAFSATSITFL